jgi:outer membrane lipoprotein-sorting protein
VFQGSKLIVGGAKWLTYLAVTAMAALAAGCGVSRVTAVKPTGAPVPLQAATKEQLIAKFNLQADAVTSINAGVTMVLTAGAAYTGVIEQYDRVNGFILAQKPSSIRVIGQAPVVGTNIFDMVSDGETFSIFIPSKNRFLTGSAHLDRPSAKPIENLRPQHLIDAIFWQAIPSADPVLFEEVNQPTVHFYVLTVAQPRSVTEAADSAAASPDWDIARKIWFDRTKLDVSEIQTYGPAGKMNSDIHYSAWNTEDSPVYPRQISVRRIAEDYELQIGITKLTLNVPVEASRFVLDQPPGSELVRVGEETKEPQPPEPKPSEPRP